MQYEALVAKLEDCGLCIDRFQAAKVQLANS